MTSEESLASILLASRLATDGVTPLTSSEYWRLREIVASPASLIGESEEALVERGLSRELAARVSSLLRRATAVAFELDGLSQSGTATLTPFDDDYPRRFERLGSRAPAVLHAVGALALLNEPGLGIVGSRDVSQEGADIAKAAAGLASDSGHPVVSGAARGVDQIAMNGAYEAGGSVLGILSDSLLRTVKRAEVRQAVHSGSTALCTPYGPDAPFSAGNAMGRNKLVYAQSSVTLVVASDIDRGGTWSGAVEAFQKGYGRVAVWRGPGEGPGNAELERRGAIAIHSIDELVPMLTSTETDKRPDERPVQASLFGS